MHQQLCNRPETSRLTPVPSFDPLLVLSETQNVGAIPKFEIDKKSQAKKTKTQPATNLSPDTTVLHKSGVSLLKPDDPMHYVKQHCLCVPVSAETAANGEPIVHRTTESYSELHPFSVVLSMDTEAWEREERLLWVPLLEAATGNPARLQRSVLRSVTDYQATEFDTPAHVASYYNAAVLHGNTPSHAGSMFACNGHYNNIVELVEYAKRTHDYLRTTHVIAEIALHVWCLVNGRFLQYRPAATRPFSSLNPPFLQVFFHSDFATTATHNAPDFGAPVEFTDAKTDVNFFEAAARVSATTFIANTLAYIMARYPGVAHSPDPCAQTDSCAHKQFHNMWEIDPHNGFRTLRLRQVPITGVAGRIQATVHGANGVHTTTASAAAAASNGTRVGEPRVPAVRWTARSTTIVQGVKELTLKIRGSSPAANVDVRPIGNKKRRGQKVAVEPTVAQAEEDPAMDLTGDAPAAEESDGKEEKKQKKKTKKGKGAKSAKETKKKTKQTESHGRKNRRDDEAAALSTCQPFAYQAMQGDHAQATFNTVGVKGELGSTVWVEHILALMETKSTRSDRIKAGIRLRSKNLADGGDEKEDKKKKKQNNSDGKAKTAVVKQIKPESVQPPISQDRLVYTFSVHHSGVLHPRPPVPANMFNITDRAHDLLSPCNMSDAAFGWSIERGVDVLFGPSGVQEDRLLPGVHVCVCPLGEQPPLHFPDCVFPPTNTVPGLYINKRTLPSFVGDLVMQANRCSDCLDPFLQFVHKRAFYKWVSIYGVLVRNMHYTIDGKKPSPEAAALLVFRHYQALTLLVRHEADVMHTLCRVMQPYFADEKGDADVASMIGLLKLGDHIYRAHLQYASTVVQRVIPGIATTQESNYASDWRQAATVFNLPGRGILAPSVNYHYQVEEWFDNTEFTILFNEHDGVTPGLLFYLKQKFPEHPNLPELCVRAVKHHITMAIEDLLALPRADTGMCPEGDVLHLRPPINAQFAGQIKALQCSYRLPIYDADNLQIYTGDHKQAVLCEYKAPIHEAIEHIITFYRRVVLLPVLQFYAYATQPCAQVWYQYHDLVQASHQVMTVPWFRFTDLCRTSPLQRELDRVAQNLCVSARSLATFFGRQPDAPSLLQLFGSQDTLLGRLSPVRLAALFALIDALAATSDLHANPQFQTDLAAFHSHVRTIGQVRKPVPAIIYVGDEKDEKDSSDGKEHKIKTEEKGESAASPVETLSETISVRSLTQMQRMRAQFLLLHLQGPGAAVTESILEYTARDLILDSERDSTVMPSHALDLLVPAFRWFFGSLAESKRAMVLSALSRTLQPRSQFGASSTDKRLSSLDLAAVRRLDTAVRVPLVTSAPVAPSPSPPRTNGTPLVAIVLPAAPSPVKDVPVVAIAVAAASPVPEVAALLEPVRVVNGVVAPVSEPAPQPQEQKPETEPEPEDKPMEPEAPPVSETEIEATAESDPEPEPEIRTEQQEQSVEELAVESVSVLEAVADDADAGTEPTEAPAAEQTDELRLELELEPEPEPAAAEEPPQEPQEPQEPQQQPPPESNRSPRKRSRSRSRTRSPPPRPRDRSPSSAKRHRPSPDRDSHRDRDRDYDRDRERDRNTGWAQRRGSREMGRAELRQWSDQGLARHRDYNPQNRSPPRFAFDQRRRGRDR